ASEDFRRLALGSWPQVIDGQRARGLGLRQALHLDKAHTTVAGDRQAFVIAEARNLGARELAGLQQRDAVLEIHFSAVDLELGHGVIVRANRSRVAPGCRIVALREFAERSSEPNCRISRAYHTPTPPPLGGAPHLHDRDWRNSDRCALR